jgi:hypothetical protein
MGDEVLALLLVPLPEPWSVTKLVTDKNISHLPLSLNRKADPFPGSAFYHCSDMSDDVNSQGLYA